MSTIALNGKRVSAGSITFPMFGTWAADLVLADPSFNTGDAEATVVVGDLTAKGTIIRAGTFAGSPSARIVGGKGGWRKTLPPFGYSHAAGVKLSSVLGDAARACGESIVVSTDRTLGPHWVREESKAEALLTLLLDGEWWMDLSGVTQMSTRDASPIVTPFTATKMSGGKGAFEIASESILPWQPGRTFQSSTVSPAQTISSVTIEATNEGKVRLHVLTTNGATERLRADIRSLIRAELAGLDYACVWEYEVTAATSTTIDAKPTDPRMPPITKCPMMPSLLGEVVTPTPGKMCRIRFVNRNPARPECIGVVGDPTLAVIAGGSEGAAREGDSVAISMAALNAAGGTNAGGPVTFASGVTGTITSSSSKVRIGG